MQESSEVLKTCKQVLYSKYNIYKGINQGLWGSSIPPRRKIQRGLLCGKKRGIRGRTCAYIIAIMLCGILYGIMRGIRGRWDACIIYGI